MPQTLVSCPNCRQPVTAEIDQLFDVNIDPSAKQRLLSGAYNLIQCPHCRYSGNLSSIIVYHDPDKELLITYVPPEINLPRNEQERLIGASINRSINNLPQEKRKAYLLNPQTALTMQGLVEKILEADGITREMIQAQQQRLNLIQRLLGITDQDVLVEIVRQEDKIIDSDFFGILRRLIEAAALGGDQSAAQALNDLQEKLLPITSFGRQLQSQMREVESVVKDLQAVGEELTREKLLDLVLKAPSDAYLQALVSLTRPGMDYAFFQILSERIDRARGEGRNRLIGTREKLLQMTREVDLQIEGRVQAARQLLTKIIQAEDSSEALLQNLPAVDDFFLQELNVALESTRQSGDQARLIKLQKLVDTLQQVSTAPPEIALIEELLDVPDDQNQEATWRKMFDEHQEEITPEFLEALASITNQVQSGDDKRLAERFLSLNRVGLRYSMERNLKG